MIISFLKVYMMLVGEFVVSVCSLFLCCVVLHVIAMAKGDFKFKASF